MMEVQTVMAPIETENRFHVKRQSVHVPYLNGEMETIGDRVRALRAAHKGRNGRPLTRQELADALGMKKTTLQTLEDKPQATSRHLPALAQFFGVSATWLQTGKGPRLPSQPLDTSSALTPANAESQAGRQSQLGGLDPAILVEAGETLDLLETTEGRPSMLPTEDLRDWLLKLSDMYGTVLDAGGSIPSRQLQEMMRAAIKRREMAGEVDEQGNRPRGIKARNGRGK